jgi:hypothetical protein
MGTFQVCGHSKSASGWEGAGRRRAGGTATTLAVCHFAAKRHATVGAFRSRLAILPRGDRSGERIPTIHVAIVDAGPSGFYAADALLRSGLPARVAMIERLPTPVGLVRGDVAPDHPKLKEAMLVYDRIARAPGFNFLGNVSVGRDVSGVGAAPELRMWHLQVKSPPLVQLPP